MTSNIDKKFEIKVKNYEIKLADIEANIQSLLKKENEQDNSLKDIKLKIKDFNIIELFKSFGNLSEKGQNDNIFISLVDNLEKNLNSKIKASDDKMLKVEESNLKMVKDVKDIKNCQDLNYRNIESNKKTIEEIYIKLRDIEKKVNFEINDITNKNKNLEELLNRNINNILNKKSENDESLVDQNNKKENDINLQNSINTLKEEISKNLDEKNKEIIKRIIEIEKNFKFLPNQDWVEDIKKQIILLKENTINYALNTELDETNNKSEEMRKELKLLREQYEDLTNRQVLNEEVQSLKRKFEIFNNRIQEIEEFCENIENKVNLNINSKIMANEKNKNLLEIKIFEEFKSQIIKEFTNVNDNFTHLRKLVDEIINTLKNKATYRDLKSLEDERNLKLEDLRLSSVKKFADRIETIKNLKYLDQQIKHIVQVYIKKIEKNENWLIAKKPINCNICASCESYIGDLKDNNPYIPWNKYPLRDPGDKIYRLGNGFSKMLQMIQVEENDKKIIPNNQNELIDYAKKLKTEKSDMDTINGEATLNKTTINNWFKSPQKNLPKIRKGMIKAKSGINITESANITNINRRNSNGPAISSSGSLDNIIQDAENKNNQADFLFEEDEFIGSPKITKIKKITKNE